MQCDKCDLYREGNQDEIVRRAGETAGKEWKAKRKHKQDVDGAQDRYKNGIEGRLQAFVDHLVESYITC